MSMTEDERHVVAHVDLPPFPKKCIDHSKGRKRPKMTTLTILAISVLAVAVLTALTKAVVRLDGYGRRSRQPSSRWPDVFDPPPWHSPGL
jgi:hypothetical protein